MKSPSVKTLSIVFGDKAIEAKRILRLESVSELPKPFDGAKRWYVRMEALNKLGEFHGVETIALGDGSFVDYLNSGDTYSTTLYRWRGNYYVGSWGDLVERHGSMDLQRAIEDNGFRQH